MEEKKSGNKTKIAFYVFVALSVGIWVLKYLDAV